MIYVQKHPAPNTYANRWDSAEQVPAGVVTEPMTEAEFSEWLAAQPKIQEPEPSE